MLKGLFVLVPMFAATLPANPSKSFKPAASNPWTMDEGTVNGHPDWRYLVLIPDLAKVRLVAALTPGGGSLESMLPADFLVAINGGYFAKDYAPTGWLVSAGKELRKQNHVSSGGVLAIKDGTATISSLAKVPTHPDFAVQNSPLLVEEGGVLGIKSENGRRAARTTACLEAPDEKGGRRLKFILLLAAPGAGPTLLETATMLAKPQDQDGFACTVALNLDGGPSSGMVLPKIFSRASYPPLVPIGYGIAVVPR